MILKESLSSCFCSRYILLFVKLVFGKLVLSFFVSHVELCDI